MLQYSKNATAMPKDWFGSVRLMPLGAWAWGLGGVHPVLGCRVIEEFMSCMIANVSFREVL